MTNKLEGMTRLELWYAIREAKSAQEIDDSQRELLRRLGASGVDVEGLLKLCAEQVALGKPSYMREAATARWLETFMAVARKHIAQPAALAWKRLPELPDEDMPVLIAVMTEVDDHGTGEWVKVPETARGTIYSHPNGVTADTDCGEFNDEEILGWQPLPAPPEAEQEESNG